ncbi:M23 family metallopeptidase [Prosthecobacter algae]|uniref:M23 family metallopeptidase n=1 Tax=Prosthecobacter algae TaxID=1144682 RepID=UPI0031E8D406
MRLPLTTTLSLLGVLAWLIWEPVGLREWTTRRKNSSARPLDPAFLRLSAADKARLPLAIRFDHPMGTAHGAFTYNAQPFRISRHLGDDLNGIGGGNSDLGDPVFAAGMGQVVYAGVPGPGWGNMVILAHRVTDLEDASQERVYQTVYAHLDKILIALGQVVNRGEKIGTVGTADGQYLAHLHFEVREGPYVNPGQGYADAPLNRVSPEAFIAQRRGAPEEQMNAAPKLNP